jgi:dipeptidyl aminopeptidase/acylaminoacyl peptidase
MGWVRQRVQCRHERALVRGFRLAEFASRPDESFSRSYRAFMDYDPIPALRRLRAPLLALLSPDDESIDAVETAAILKALVKAGTDVTIKLYPGYDHTMRRLGAGGVAPRRLELPLDHFDVQIAFIQASDARKRDPD